MLSRLSPVRSAPAGSICTSQKDPQEVSQPISGPMSTVMRIKGKERDLKIIAASLQSAMKSKKGTSSSSAAPAAEIMNGITGHQTFKIGSYIIAMFTHKEEGVKMHLGQITGMTNRPGGGAKAVKWRLEVDRGAIPDSLWLRCAWFLPHVPSDNPDGFDRITTPFFSWDPSKVVDDNIQEFQAKKIVECFDDHCH